jgi:hypothetical protein
MELAITSGLGEYSRTYIISQRSWWYRMGIGWKTLAVYLLFAPFVTCANKRVM